MSLQKTMLFAALGLGLYAAGCGDSKSTTGTTSTSTTTTTSSTSSGMSSSSVTSSSGAGGSTSSSSSGAGGMAGVSCTDYCTAIMANCTMGTAQYADMDGCMGWCASLPPGTAADTSGDTVGCRTYHAGAAKADAMTHCAHAGPLGEKTCGPDQCEPFCDVATATCATEWPDKAACMTACAKFTVTPKYAGGDPASGQQGGDTLNCRAYHLSVASSSMANAMTHCPHTQETPTGPCK